MLNWLPENVSSLGQGVDHLFELTYILCVVIFLLVNAFYLYFIIRYRRKKRGERAHHSHGSNVLELAWTALPLALFAFLAFYSDVVWREIKYPSHAPKADFTVEVVGQTYMWHVRYPGSDGIFGHREREFMSPTNPFGIDYADPNGRDDVVAINQIHLPYNKNIRVRLSSMDVIHSFFLPNMRIKQDAVPGQWVDVWFNSTRPGKFELACAELCGSGHYLMRGEVTMHGQAEFDAWIDTQYKVSARRAPSPPVAASAAPTPSPKASGK